MALRVVDAVLVVPGVMGSELVDSRTRKVLWGLNASVLGQAWLTGEMRSLVLDPEGTTFERVEPTRLLRTPAWAPVLRVVGKIAVFGLGCRQFNS